jgi:hypothetical protein
MRDILSKAISGSMIAGAALLVAACGGDADTTATNNVGVVADDPWANDMGMGNDLGYGNDMGMGMGNDLGNTGTPVENAQDLLENAQQELQNAQ